MAAILALGSTGLWPLSVGVAVITLYWRRGYRIKTSIPVVLTTAAILPSIIYSPSEFKALYFVIAIWLSHFILANEPSKRNIFLVFFPILLFQVGISTWEMTQNFDARIHGLNRNATEFGLSAFLIPTSILIVPLIGFSLARLVLASYFIFAVLHNTRKTWLIFGLSAIVFVSISVLNGTSHRLVFGNVRESTELRVDAITGNSTEDVNRGISESTHAGSVTFSGCGERRNREWRLLGYGYGGYCVSTGQIQPHSSFVSPFWELGLLSIPLYAAVGWLFWRAKNPYLIVLVFAGLLTDAFYSSISGPFIVTGFHIFTRNLKLGLDFGSVSGKLGLMRMGIRFRAAG